jgi:hypothetical protein
MAIDVTTIEMNQLLKSMDLDYRVLPLSSLQGQALQPLKTSSFPANLRALRVSALSLLRAKSSIHPRC